MNIRKSGYVGLLCFCMMGSLITGCTQPTKHKVEENLLGIQPLDSQKQIITITANAALDHFIAEAEKRFPEIHIVQDSYTGPYRIGEHVAHIEHHDFGDIIMVKAGHIPKIDMSDHLLDLSTQAFPSNFNASTLQTDEESHISLIPGPLSFNCNMYNATLFEERGWSVPTTYEEFLSLVQAIDETGIRGFRNAYFDSGAQSYQIYQYSVISALNTLTQVEGQLWHNQLVAGENVSLEPMEVAFENMQELMDAGALQEEDLNVSFNANMDAMANREVAIAGGEIDHIQGLNARGSDEFRFMPHFSMSDEQGWLLNLGYYFGANRNLKEEGNEKKLQATMELMEFIASEEGQNLLIEDGLGMLPSTRGANIPDTPMLEHIRKQIESGRYIMRPGYDMFTSVLSTEIAAFIRNETDSDAILEKCRSILEQGISSQPSLGQAQENFTVLQTGCLKADALRAAANTDIALIGMSEIDHYDPVGGTRAKFYQGAITEDDIVRVAQTKLDSPLYCHSTTVTGEALLALLEYGATSLEEQEQGEVSHFHPFAVSGLKLTYHPYADMGKRVTNVRLADGSNLKLDQTYTISYLEGVFPEEVMHCAKSDITMTNALRDYVTTKKEITPDRDRITLNYLQ